MFLEIIGETSEADAIIASDVKVLASQCAIREMNSGVATVHPCAAESAAPQDDGSIALPILGIAILSPDCEANCGRTLPFPVTEKFIRLPRHKCPKRIWRYCALNVQAKIRRSIQEISSQLPRFMANTQVANECAHAVPRTIARQNGERDRFVTELSKSGVPDYIGPKSIRPET